VLSCLQIIRQQTFGGITAVRSPTHSRDRFDLSQRNGETVWVHPLAHASNKTQCARPLGSRLDSRLGPPASCIDTSGRCCPPLPLTTTSHEIILHDTTRMIAKVVSSPRCQRTPHTPTTPLESTGIT
jgi:hypothetical protein